MPTPEALLRRSRIRMTPSITERLNPQQEASDPTFSIQGKGMDQILQEMQQAEAEQTARFSARGDASTKTLAPVGALEGLQGLVTAKGDISAPYQRQMGRINAIQNDSDMFAQMRAQAEAALQGAGGGGTGVQIPGGTDQGSKIVAAAMRQLGIPYSWGGGGSKGKSRGIAQGRNTVGFDCSGLVQYAYAQVGLKMPRVSYGQLKSGSRAALSSLRPGDLVGFGNGHHIGIYIGNGKYIHAPQTGDVVKISKLSGRKDAWGVKIIR